MRTARKWLGSERAWLAAILVSYTVLGVVYSVVTPLFEASDELWHYPMVRYVAQHAALPLQRAGLSDAEAPWRQEGGQPPLYYTLGALATFWIDTSDMPQVRELNPHPDIGVVLPDGNVAMTVHRANTDHFPWHGTALAVHIVRLLSVLMGLGTVWVTYRLGRELFPARAEIALAGAAITAFTPMFLFISASVNNDNLATLLAGGVLWMLVHIVRRADPPSRRFYVLLGLATGAGMLAKFQLGFLIPLIALALGMVSARQRNWRPLVEGGAIAGALTVLLAGWWYARNYTLYGDATGINVFLDIVGRRAVPADWHQLWTEREVFAMSYWGFFGGLNVPMPKALYTFFNGVAGFAALGGLATLAREALFRLRTRTCPPDQTLVQARFLAALWPLLVFGSLLSWTRQTWASQGRLWFSAIAALSVWMAAGLAAWAGRSAKGRRALLGGIGGAFALIAAFVPFAVIHPAYTFHPDVDWARAPYEGAEVRRACFYEDPAAARATLCMDYHPLSGDLRVGDYVKFAPTFIAEDVPSRDYSVFVHLVSAETGAIEAQRDVYPGGGLLLTSELEAGARWRNPLAVALPPTLYAPQVVDVYLGLYDLRSGERLVVRGDGADEQGRRVHLGQIALRPPADDVPNPVHVNFGGVLELRGYTLGERSVQRGSAVDVALYWQALTAPTRDYTISVQLIDPETLTKAAQMDAPPTPPTSAWERGEHVRLERTLTVFEDAPSGRYRLRVSVYDAETLAPLHVRGEAGAQSESAVLLGWVVVK